MFKSRKFAYIKCQLETEELIRFVYICNILNLNLQSDPKYGPRKTIQANGQLLHACALEFVHPTTYEKMHFEVPANQRLKKYNELREGENNA